MAGRLALAVLLIGGMACGRVPQADRVVRPQPVQPTVAPSQPADTEEGEEPTPPPGLPATAIPGTEVVAFPNADGLLLVGRMFGQSRDAGVVLVHASGADMTAWFPFAQRLMDAGYRALAFNLRGYGESEGSRDPQGAPNDVLAAVDVLRASGVRRIGLVGAEVGGTASVAAAAEGGVRALAVVGAGPSFGSLDVSSQARRVKARTLVLTNGHDGGERLASMIDKAAGEVVTLPADPAADPGVQDRLLTFLDDALA